MLVSALYLGGMYCSCMRYAEAVSRVCICRRMYLAPNAGTWRVPRRSIWDLTVVCEGYLGGGGRLLHCRHH
eukprot:2960482-Rhodomonas_salina.1